MSSGRCLCGAVRFEVAGPIDQVGHCHCTICQRGHGAAFVTWAAIPSERLRVTTGAAALVDYRSSDIGTRSFCSACGSSLFCRLSTHPGVVDVALACLAPGHGAIPRAHLFWDDRAEWLAVGDGLPRLGGKTGREPR